MFTRYLGKWNWLIIGIRDPTKCHMFFLWRRSVCSDIFVCLKCNTYNVLLRYEKDNWRRTHEKSKTTSQHVPSIPGGKKMINNRYTRPYQMPHVLFLLWRTVCSDIFVCLQCNTSNVPLRYEKDNWRRTHENSRATFQKCSLDTWGNETD